MSVEIPPAASYLTDALRKYGVLNDGHVREVIVESDRPTLLSRILRLRLSYDRVEPDAPQTIFVKTGLGKAAVVTWDGARSL